MNRLKPARIQIYHSFRGASYWLTVELHAGAKGRGRKLFGLTRVDDRTLPWAIYEVTERAKRRGYRVVNPGVTARLGNLAVGGE